MLSTSYFAGDRVALPHHAPRAGSLVKQGKANAGAMTLAQPAPQLAEQDRDRMLETQPHAATIRCANRMPSSSPRVHSLYGSQMKDSEMNNNALPHRLFARNAERENKRTFQQKRVAVSDQLSSSWLLARARGDEENKSTDELCVEGKKKKEEEMLGNIDKREKEQNEKFSILKPKFCHMPGHRCCNARVRLTH